MKKCIIVMCVLAMISTVFAVSYTLDVHVSDSSARPVKGVSLDWNCLEKFYDFPGYHFTPRHFNLKDSDATGASTMSDYQCTEGNNMAGNCSRS